MSSGTSLSRRVMLAFAMSATAFGIATAPVRAADPSAEATQFIQTLGDKAVKVIADKSISPQQRTDDFRTLLTQGFDIPTIGRFTLGRYWRNATDEQRTEFMKLFQEMIVQTYATRFSQYSGETFSATGTRADGEDLIVSSVINRPATGQPVRVEWRVAHVNGQMKIQDVMVEGVSMTVTQRDDFSSVIQRAGGEINGLLAQMKQRIGQQG